ncbi:MAG: hypothetical protein LBI87_00865 [Candidatus Accumulibacter sp.]|jgi:hypothetical protein|nr:hypothetical protein [Accumulibacter sp.]
MMNLSTINKTKGNATLGSPHLRAPDRPNPGQSSLVSADDPPREKPRGLLVGGRFLFLKPFEAKH